MAEYKREVGAAVTAGVVLAVFAAIIAISSTPTNTSSSASPPASTTHSTTNSTLAILSTPTSATYRVITSNITLTGHAATVPCAVLTDLVSSCTPASNASLSNVDLVEYGDAYYYSYQNQSATIGFAHANYPYEVWFTNSTVFCVSYAQPEASLCASLPYGPETIGIPSTSASVLEPSIGLRLGLSLSTNSTGVIEATVSEFNTLASPNNVTAAGNLPPDFDQWQGGVCSGSQVGYQVLEGNYGMGNYTDGAALVFSVQSSVQCIGGSGTSASVFPPLSYVANLSRASSGFWIGTSDVFHGNACSDLNPSSSCGLSFIPFPPGVYTVVAGDDWGGRIILHFTVQVSV